MTSDIVRLIQKTVEQSSSERSGFWMMAVLRPEVTITLPMLTKTWMSASAPIASGVRWRVMTTCTTSVTMAAPPCSKKRQKRALMAEDFMLRSGAVVGGASRSGAACSRSCTSLSLNPGLLSRE